MIVNILDQTPVVESTLAIKTMHLVMDVMSGSSKSRLLYNKIKDVVLNKSDASMDLLLELLLLLLLLLLYVFIT